MGTLKNKYLQLHNREALLLLGIAVLVCALLASFQLMSKPYATLPADHVYGGLPSPRTSSSSLSVRVSSRSSSKASVSQTILQRRAARLSSARNR